MQIVTSAARKVLADALALPEEDRLRLAESLLDTVAPEPAEEIEQAWSQEASRRAGAMERGEAAAVDGEEALRQLEDKLRSVRPR